ncbi:undecaprenyl-diphosphate phosphatase [Pelagibacteraceae bacterium]|nr:undecaprenyl-diphosphate phosphatase [Pelagibacteraceae bacterium]
MSLSIYLNTFFLAIIQGVTEWLPISSSGLLVIFEELIKLEDKNLNLLFNIAVHGGSLIAVVIHFLKDLLQIFINYNLIKNIIIATIPVVIAGFLIKITGLNIFLQDIKVVAFATLFFSIVLYFSDKTKVTIQFNKNISNKNALLIGLAQVLALIPGTSRSGITISCARFLGFSRVDSAKFSFLISIPVLFAACVLGFSDVVFEPNNQIIILIIFGFFVSLITSLLCIKVFLKFVENNSLNLFVVLRIILGTILLIYLAN